MGSIPIGATKFSLLQRSNDMNLVAKVKKLRGIYATLDYYDIRKVTDDLRLLGYLGGGVSRRVFAYGDFVIKIDVEGGYSNKKEAATWRDVANTKFKNYFAKVLWVSSDGKILVAERIQGEEPPRWRYVADEPWTPEQIYRDKVMKFITKMCRREFGVNDIHTGNVIFKGRVPKVVDYAE